jgi:hypothetical protein
VNIEFKQVIERVGYKVDGTIDIFLHAEDKFQRSSGLVTGWKWDIDEVSRFVRDVLARITDKSLVAERDDLGELRLTWSG